MAQLSEKVCSVRRISPPSQHAPEKHDQTPAGALRGPTGDSSASQAGQCANRFLIWFWNCSPPTYKMTCWWIVIQLPRQHVCLAVSYQVCWKESVLHLLLSISQTWKSDSRCLVSWKHVAIRSEFSAVRRTIVADVPLLSSSPLCAFSPGLEWLFHFPSWDIYRSGHVYVSANVNVVMVPIY